LRFSRLLRNLLAIKRLQFRVIVHFRNTGYWRKKIALEENKILIFLLSNVRLGVCVRNHKVNSLRCVYPLLPPSS